MSGRDQAVIEWRGGRGAGGGIRRRVGYDSRPVVALLSLFLAIFIKFEAIILPACASAALLQKVVPGPDPLKESSSGVEPLVVRLSPVHLHLINRKHCYLPLDNI